MPLTERADLPVRRREAPAWSASAPSLLVGGTVAGIRRMSFTDVCLLISLSGLVICEAAGSRSYPLLATTLALICGTMYRRAPADRSKPPEAEPESKKKEDA